jgi:diacylglycerol kinase family enzyme
MTQKSMADPTATLQTTARSVVIAVNPNSGASDRGAIVDALADRLKERGLHVEQISDINALKHRVTELAAEDDLRAVVAAGGDGTVALLANELDSGIPIAILPLGTENLLAKFLTLAADADQVAQVIGDGRVVQLDAGRANGKRFLVMASCGFDAAVVSKLHAGRRGHIRHWSYARPILSVIRRYQYPPIRLIADGQLQPWDARWAFVFNVARYAMNLPIVPDADATDGQLDLCAFRVRGLLEGIGALGAVILRRHRQWAAAKQLRFKTLRIESDQPVPYQLDGDPGGMLPVEITVEPACLNMLVPKNWSAE